MIIIACHEVFDAPAPRGDEMMFAGRRLGSEQRVLSGGSGLRKGEQQRLYILPALKRPQQTEQADIADKRFKDGCKGLKLAGIFFPSFFAFSSATIRDFEIDVTLFIQSVIKKKKKVKAHLK